MLISETYFADMGDEELITWGKERLSILNELPIAFTRTLLHRMEELLDETAEQDEQTEQGAQSQ